MDYYQLLLSCWLTLWDIKMGRKKPEEEERTEY